MRNYQVVSMHASADGTLEANVLVAEDSPVRVEMYDTKFPHTVLTRYFTTLQQAEDAAENYVLRA